MEQRYNARDRTVLKNGRNGATRENLHTNEAVRISKREADFSLNAHQETARVAREPLPEQAVSSKGRNAFGNHNSPMIFPVNETNQTADISGDGFAVNPSAENDFVSENSYRVLPDSKDDFYPNTALTSGQSSNTFCEHSNHASVSKHHFQPVPKHQKFSCKEHKPNDVLSGPKFDYVGGILPEKTAVDSEAKRSEMYPGDDRKMITGNTEPAKRVNTPIQHREKLSFMEKAAKSYPSLYDNSFYSEALHDKTSEDPIQRKRNKHRYFRDITDEYGNDTIGAMAHEMHPPNNYPEESVGSQPDNKYHGDISQEPSASRPDGLSDFMYDRSVDACGDSLPVKRRQAVRHRGFYRELYGGRITHKRSKDARPHYSGHIQLSRGKAKSDSKKSSRPKQPKRLLFDDEPSVHGIKKPKRAQAAPYMGITGNLAGRMLESDRKNDDSDDTTQSLVAGGSSVVSSGYGGLYNAIRAHSDTASQGRLRFERSNNAFHYGNPDDRKKGRDDNALLLSLDRRASPGENRFPPENDAAQKLQKRIIKKRYQEAYYYSRNRKVPSLSPAILPQTEKALSAPNPVKKIAPVAIKEAISAAKKSSAAVLASLAMALVMVMSSFSGCVAAIGGMTTVMASTYPGTDEDITDVDAAYCQLEDALDEQVNSMEDSHPGYDEYRYSVDEITHNPFQLASLLSAKFGNYTPADVTGELPLIFDMQYTLTVGEETETRVREEPVTRTRTVTDPDTGEETEEEYEDTEEAEYEWRILNISLVNHGLDYVAAEYLSDEQIALYQAYNATLGNRKELFDEAGITASPGGGAGGGSTYDIPPEALSDERFRNMINEAEKYLGCPYVWGGSSPSTSFDCSGFVSWVINNSGNGWSVGRKTAEGLRGICAPVSAADAKPGDLIFFQGTYSTAGASHVGIYVGNNIMIHCGDPIQYANINTPYWQSHFYQFGRLE